MDVPLFIAIASGLSGAFAWGMSDFLAAKSTKKGFGSFTTAFFMDLLGAVFFAVIYFLFLHPTVVPQPLDVMYAIFSGITASLGAVFFVKGLSYGPVSLVSPLGGLYPLVTTVLAILVFGAQLSPGQMIGIALVIAGGSAAAGLIGDHGKKGLGRGPIFAVFASLCWGSGFAVMGEASTHMGWELATFIETASIVATFVIMAPFMRGENIVKATPKALASPILILAGVLQIIGNGATNLGLAQGVSLGAVAVAISASYPILTILLALTKFREKVRPLHLSGAVLGIAGVVILSLG